MRNQGAEKVCFRSKQSEKRTLKNKDIYRPEADSGLCDGVLRQMSRRNGFAGNKIVSNKILTNKVVSRNCFLKHSFFSELSHDHNEGFKGKS